MVLNQKQNLESYQQPLEESAELLHEKPEENFEEIIDLTEAAEILEEMPQRTLHQNQEARENQKIISPEKKEKTETFKVTLAGKEFVLPKTMKISWPEKGSSDREEYDYTITDLYEELDSYNETLNSLSKKLNELRNNSQNESVAAAEELELMETIQEKQSEKTELEGLIQSAVNKWESQKKYYQVDLATLKNLLENKRQEIADLSKNAENDFFSAKNLENEIEEAEREYLYLKKEYESYQLLSQDFQGRVKVKNVFLPEEYLKKYENIWNLKVPKIKKGDEVPLPFTKEIAVQSYDVDMAQYVENNRKALELLLASGGNLEEFDLGLQENKSEASLEMSISFGGQKYSFDLAKVQSDRYKIFQKMKSVQDELEKDRQVRYSFLENHALYNELKLAQQEAFQSWVNSKNGQRRWEQANQIVWKTKLDEARASKDENAYNSLLAEWENLLEYAKRLISQKEGEFDLARLNYLEFQKEVNTNLGIVAKEKKLESLKKEYDKLIGPLSTNPAWRYMNLFPLAIEEVKNSHND